MRKLLNYLIFKTPESRMGLDNNPPQPKALSGARIALSFLGLFLGIFLSFIVVGLDSGTPQKARQETSEKAKQDTAATSDPKPDPKQDKTVNVVGVNSVYFWKVFLITIVICGLTYQGLYTSLKLYLGEPVFLTIFVAFQYGYFWQSVIHASVHP